MLEFVDRFRPRTDRAFVERVVAAALDFAGRPDQDVSLLLTDDAEIARLHDQFMGDPTPTDVMSFALDETSEVVISVETARRVAMENATSTSSEQRTCRTTLHCCSGQPN